MYAAGLSLCVYKFAQVIGADAGLHADSCL